uniref:NADH dehydrogenase subunit 1 n=1 Tax=Aonchotheca putorii TaxID=1647945 RepID=UPI00237B7EF2|nr:NADH dehydrogenase subunit 1 [Aonchotheca putorii]WBV76990.1 NADH dehydrogenase subunit 1 [Aonchotheca putorii]
MFSWILMWLLQLVLMLFSILMSVAFITLLERAYMGISQRRRGPNKVSFWGLLQPVIDGIKLMLKSNNKSFISNFLLFSIIPALNLIIFLMFWTSVPFYWNLINFQLNSMFIIILLGMMGFGLLLSGWISNSKYALFGSLRSMIQSISYEICLSLVILMILNLKDSLCLNVMWKGFMNLEMMMSIFLSLPVIIMILAECGRTPFDLMEAESELVSGFNVEFSSVEFAFLFMGEYGMIIILSIIFSMIISPNMIGTMILFFVSSILYMRYTLPRVRYDFLMQLMWKSMLPLIILIWMMSLNMKIL